MNSVVQETAQTVDARKRALITPRQFKLSIQDADLSSYTPSLDWEKAPPTDEQLRVLEKQGIFPDEVENAGEAAKLLECLLSRRMDGLSTPKQIRFLEKKGFRRVGTWTFYDAKAMVDRIAANGWMVTEDTNPAVYFPDSISS